MEETAEREKEKEWKKDIVVAIFRMRLSLSIRTEVSLRGMVALQGYSHLDRHFPNDFQNLNKKVCIEY